jgi:hypothetical protein
MRVFAALVFLALATLCRSAETNPAAWSRYGVFEDEVRERNPALAETNGVILISAEKRPGAAIFVDECLTRALTNSISIGELRRWATNMIEKYRGGHAQHNGDLAVGLEDIPPAIRTIHLRVPACRFSYAEATNKFYTIRPDPQPARVSIRWQQSGEIERMQVSWYLYGIIVGPESFKLDPVFWYQREFAPGIYIWHGYK